MPDLMLRDLPPKMMREVEEWAALSRTTPEAAAKELLRIALHVTADRHQPPRAARATRKPIQLTGGVLTRPPRPTLPLGQQHSLTVD
jgi:hypothetical protein